MRSMDLFGRPIILILSFLFLDSHHIPIFPCLSNVLDVELTDPPINEELTVIVIEPVS